jgi:hypothetical protein
MQDKRDQQKKLPGEGKMTLNIETGTSKERIIPLLTLGEAELDKALNGCLARDGLHLT